MATQANGKTISTLPVEGSCCGIKPSKEALETGYGIDFSSVEKLRPKAQDSSEEEPTKREK